MEGFRLLDAERLASLAAGRGGVPLPAEWPVLGVVVLLFALAAGWVLVSFGLTRLEAGLVSGVAPFLVLFDAPLGSIGPDVALAANAAGCVVPFVVGLKVLLEGRASTWEAVVLVALSSVVSFASAEVVPARGVLLHYRIPAVATGVLAAAFFFRTPLRAGAAAYAAGAVGVVLGADLFHLEELAAGGMASRIVLGGAGLLDGIYLVAFFSAAVAAATAYALRWLVEWGLPRRSPA